MQIELNSLQHQERNWKDTFICERKNRRWYITLFFYNGSAFNERDYELEEATEKLLDSIANGRKKIRLYFSVEPLGGSDTLELVECCAPPDGGGMYRRKTSGKHNGEIIWICDLALIVFADIPEKIYMKRLRM
jgi:hypothetical protein